MSDAFAKQREFLRLSDAAEQIASSPAADWETKYDLIFSEDISRRVRALGMEPEYYDPDTSCEDDVLAYVGALREKAAQIRLALGDLVSLPADECNEGHRQ